MTLLGILCIKSVFLLADSRPGYLFGDSEAYLATATTKWIPPDRSFVYGLLLRGIAYHMHSLEAMIWMQVLLSALAAWLLAFALGRLFSAPLWLAAVFGVLCSVEPMQLLYERFVLTECCANFLFALHLVMILVYVKRGRLWTLIGAQVIGVLVISFRISFLPVVLANSVMAPLLSPHSAKLLRNAWKRLDRKAWGCRSRQVWLIGAHLCVSLLVSQGLLRMYGHWYGKLRGSEPALFYQGGAFLVADFAPLIEPEDFPDASKRVAIFTNLRHDRHDILARPAQHFLQGGLWSNILKEFPDEKQANDLATATAMHAVLRQPLRTIRLAYQTFLLYFHPTLFPNWVFTDQGGEAAGKRLQSRTTRDYLENIYGVSNQQDYETSLTKKWHMFALPWYRLVLCALALWPLAVLFFPRSNNWPLIVLCAITALILLGGATLTVDRPTPRFLTSAAWLVLLLFGLVAERAVFFIGRRFAAQG